MKKAFKIEQLTSDFHSILCGAKNFETHESLDTDCIRVSFRDKNTHDISVYYRYSHACEKWEWFNIIKS